MCYAGPARRLSLLHPPLVLQAMATMASDGVGGGPPTGGSGRGDTPTGGHGDKGDDVTCNGGQWQWVAMPLAVVCCGSLVGAGMHNGMIGASKVMSSSVERSFGGIGVVVREGVHELAQGIKEAAKTNGQEISWGFTRAACVLAAASVVVALILNR